jgi:hypothetical protein
MFKIYGNRDELWQWDLNQKLIVENDTINEVHFCDGVGNCSLVCKVYNFDGLRVANIPNVILQDNCDMNTFAFVRAEDGSYTKHREILKVNKRSKPADYVYTENEVKTWEALSERVDEIEKNGISNEVIEGAVEKYLNENPIDVPEVDLSGYATKEEVNGKATINDMTDYIEEHKEELKGADGKDGIDGTNGKDGYTPIKGVDYFDGKDGEKGEQGEKGTDGKTPVKGTDYYTEADKQEMINSVIEALPKYNGGVS